MDPVPIARTSTLERRVTFRETPQIRLLTPVVPGYLDSDAETPGKSAPFVPDSKALCKHAIRARAIHLEVGVLPALTKTRAQLVPASGRPR